MDALSNVSVATALPHLAKEIEAAGGDLRNVSLATALPLLRDRYGDQPVGEAENISIASAIPGLGALDDEPKGGQT